MSEDFVRAFGNWYLITIDILLIIGITFFARLPKHQRKDSYYWLPFLILVFTISYENFGGYTNYNLEFKKSVNAYLGNTDFPKYNLWLYNITSKQISTVLYLLLIKIWIEPSNKKYINWIVILFVCVALVVQLSGMEPVYLNQPTIAAMAATMILAATALYFFALITNEKYLESKPLRLLSFWQTTIFLFCYSLTYLNSVSRVYIYNINPQLARNLAELDRVFGVLFKLMLLVIIISPFIPKAFDPEPFSQPNQNPSVKPNF